jgi:DNA-binding transcriptional LysR family regulator
MHIEVLKTFCDLVETRNLSRAAEPNFMTQPAVSQQIRTLEEIFARRLLNRPDSGRQEFTPSYGIRPKYERDKKGRVGATKMV